MHMKATYCKWKIAVNKKANGSVTVCNNLISVNSPSLSKAWKDIKHSFDFRCKVGKGATPWSVPPGRTTEHAKAAFLARIKCRWAWKWEMFAWK